MKRTAWLWSGKRGFILGLVVALVGITVPEALAGTGVGGVFNLGVANTVDRTTRLVGTTGANLRITNTGTGTALVLRTDPGTPPLRVNSSTKVRNLNADLLDGVDSAGFLAVDGTAVNADKLDNLDSTDFLAATGTAVNADALDGLDSATFLRTARYRQETAQSIGVLLADTTRYLDASCDVGDTLLSGGIANVDKNTVLLESFPITTGTWRVRWQNDGSNDSVSAIALCSNTTP